MYPLWPVYLGTSTYLMRPQGEGAPPGRRPIYGEKNQILNLAFFILVQKFYCFCIKPNVFVY